MKKMKKLICLLCAVIMVLSSLTACQGTTNPSDGTTAAPAETKASEEATEGTSVPETDAVVSEPKQELPISDGSITLKVALVVSSKVEDINTNKLTLYIEETTGINLEIIELSSSDTATQVNTLMNGGELPDVFLCYAFPYDTLCSYADAGLLAPLDEYVDEWGYNLKNTIMADPDLGENVLSYATYDGHLWGMPSGGALVTNVYGSNMPRIQTAFLDEFGMDVPKTLDELRTFLEKVHDTYPEVIPMTSWADRNYVFDVISQAYQYTDMGTYLKVNDGQVEFIANNDKFKEAIEYTKKMVEDGLIDPAAFTQDQDTLSTLFAKDGNNVAFLAAGAFLTSVMDSKGEEYNTMKMVGTLEGPYGYVSPQILNVAPQVSMVVTSACEYPEEAFRLFDFFLSDDFALTARVGFEGEQWKKAEDGVLGRDGEQAWFELLTAQEWVQASTNVIWMRENFIHSNIMNHCAASSTTSKYPVATDIVEQDLANMVTGEQLPALVMPAEDMTEYNELKELIVDNVKANVAQFILGNRDLSEWDDYCNELEKMDFERYVELAQAAYDEMTGN